MDRAPPDRERVYFGAWVELEDERGETVEHRIVGPDETDARKGWISVDSPLARAALKKRVDEEFVAELPGGKARFLIVGVHYPQGA